MNINEITATTNGGGIKLNESVIPSTYSVSTLSTSSSFSVLIDRDCTLSPITRMPPIDTMYYFARDHIPNYNKLYTYPNDPEYNPNTNGVTNFSYAFYGMYYCEDTIGSIMNRFDWNSCTDMSYAFRGSAGRYTNLVGSIPFIPKNVINLCSTFNYCSLLSGNIPSIPNSVKDMSGTFYYCYRLKGSIPNIPNSVTSIDSAFFECRNLTGTIPNIPNSVTDMSFAFKDCYNLTGSIPNIPNSVTNMAGTFSRCINLTGGGDINIPSSVINMFMAFANCSNLASSNLYIHSNNVINVFDFLRGCKVNNVYVHANTVTYNTVLSEFGPDNDYVKIF